MGLRASCAASRDSAVKMVIEPGKPTPAPGAPCLSLCYGSCDVTISSPPPPPPHLSAYKALALSQDLDDHDAEDVEWRSDG